MTETAERSTRKRVKEERPLSLSEVAEILHMKRPNVAKFLARRGVEPAFAKAQGFFWWESDILKVKAEREADEERMAADAQRRRSAQARVRGEVPAEPPRPEVRLGERQTAVMLQLLRRPVAPTDEVRFSLLRLAKRGLVERFEVDGVRRYRLTDEGRRVAGSLS